MRSKTFLVVAALLAVAVFLNLPIQASARAKAFLRDNLAPLHGVVSFLSYEAKEFLGSFVKAGKTAAEKERLLLEVGELRETVRSLKALERENDELRKQLGFMRQSRRKLVLCRVIARDMSGWWQTVRLNKGSDDGILPDRSVVAVEGLVGRTKEVSRRTCDVLLITDPTCKVGCRLVRSGSYGVAAGSGVPLGGEATVEARYYQGGCRADYLPKEREVLPDDEAVTSGLGGVFPEGIVIGRVCGVKIDASGLYKTVELAPAAGLDALRYVFVILD